MEFKTTKIVVCPTMVEWCFCVFVLLWGGILKDVIFFIISFFFSFQILSFASSLWSLSFVRLSGFKDPCFCFSMVDIYIYIFFTAWLSKSISSFSIENIHGCKFSFQTHCNAFIYRTCWRWWNAVMYGGNNFKESD